MVKSLTIGASPQTPKIKLSNESNKLIPEATNRETFHLTVVDPVHTAIAVTQVAAPGTACIVLRRTPPATVLANVDE